MSVTTQAVSVPVERVSEFDILGHSLALDTVTGVLIRFARKKGRQPQVACIAQFTPQELDVLRVLLTNFPDYCPQEAILATIKMRDIEWCRRYVDRKLAEGQARRDIMASVRNVIGRIRAKIKPMGLDLKSIVDTGYMFDPVK